MWIQREIPLLARPRGFHLVTEDVLRQLPEVRDIQTGLLHLFVRHTSASITLNENAAPEVRQDFESFFTRAVPENAPWCRHRDEGPDDLPAHIKSALLGCELTLPITAGAPNLGTWQGIWLCEHRNHGGSRTLVATLHGETRHA